MTVDITKIQFLSDRDSGHPIFYCHAEDDGHFPQLTVQVVDADSVAIVTDDTVFKVKRNPQRKNRVDIYMPIAAANELGRELVEACPRAAAIAWGVSNANPHAVAGGRMALPDIVWSRYGRFELAVAIVRSGTRMQKQNGTMYVELETPVANHIRMRTAEIHLGIALEPPTGVHDPRQTVAVNVPEGELQRGTGEQNPIQKVVGRFSIQLSKGAAAGLGAILQAATEPR